MPLCAYRIILWGNTRKNQIVLYLIMPKTSCLISTSQSLNTHLLLSHAEPDFLLSSHGLLLCQHWWWQRLPHSLQGKVGNFTGWEHRITRGTVVPASGYRWVLYYFKSLWSRQLQTGTVSRPCESEDRLDELFQGSEFYVHDFYQKDSSQIATLGFSSQFRMSCL